MTIGWSSPKRGVGGSNPLVDGQRGMISRNREIIPFFIGNVSKTLPFSAELQTNGRNRQS